MTADAQRIADKIKLAYQVAINDLFTAWPLSPSVERNLLIDCIAEVLAEETWLTKPHQCTHVDHTLYK